MKLQQLKYLLAIVDNGLNITAAAERLYTSQPGVSKQLKLLEEELGMQLFARKGKSLHRVTRAGEQVVERARLIMSEVEKIRSLASDFYQEEEGILTIAATNTQARYVLPKVLGELRQQYPKVRLNLHQGTSEQVADMMTRNEIDFAIASGDNSANGFGDLLRVPAYHWDRVVLVPAGHPLTAVDRKLTLEDLVEYPLVSYMFSFENEQSLRELFVKKGLDPNIVCAARDPDIIKTYVRMGVGIGIVASMAYESADRQTLAALPVNGAFDRSTTWIGMRRNKMLRCYMADFLRLVAPHLSNDQIERLIRASSQAEVDQVTRNSGLPVRNGIGGKFSVAA
jgi:LysR family cys regulon transcriptional activator